ncbi:MAG: type II toxin-antitoxin system VapC family toxin [Hyphomicrobiaceae bacterium]
MTPPRFLLDTNVIIGLAKGPGAARDLVDAASASPNQCAVSQISRIELLSFPLISDVEEAGIHMILDAMMILPLDEKIEVATIAIRRRTRLKLPDAMIAATAQMHGLTLLTLDERFRAAIADS